MERIETSVFILVEKPEYAWQRLDLCDCFHFPFFSVVFLLTALVAYGVCSRTEFYQHYLGEKPQDLETKQVTLLFSMKCAILNNLSVSRLRDRQLPRFIRNAITAAKLAKSFATSDF